MIQTASLFERNRTTPAQADRTLQMWKRGPAAPVIWPNEVHVWRARLDVPWSWTLDETLSLADRTRANRFRFESDRRRFCVARASLRLILGRYLRTKPGRLQLDTNEFGKPLFADQKAAQGLRFNLSHSHQIALIAVARDREVGVDIEYIRPDFVTNEAANHFFSALEAEQFRSLPRAARPQSFFNCWTRKEAYIKARGEGFSCPLDQFEVTLAPDAPAALLNSRIEAGEVERWSLQDLFPAPGYAAAFAVDGDFSRLVLWDLV